MVCCSIDTPLTLGFYRYFIMALFYDVRQIAVRGDRTMYLHYLAFWHGLILHLSFNSPKHKDIYLH